MALFSNAKPRLRLQPPNTRTPVRWDQGPSNDLTLPYLPLYRPCLQTVTFWDPRGEGFHIQMLGDMAEPVTESFFHTVWFWPLVLLSWPGFPVSRLPVVVRRPQHLLHGCLQAPGASVWMFLVSQALFLPQHPMHTFLLIGRRFLFSSLFQNALFFCFP